MSKRMTRVLSLILTLVMFVSVSTPAFAWGGGDVGSGWGREIGEDDFRDFTPADEVEEEKEEYDYFQTDGAEGFQVTVEAPMGSLPTLAELRAEPVEIEDVREAVESVVEGETDILVAMDISFWMNGVEIEPEEPVRVKISAPELDGQDNLVVIHIPDAEEPETVDMLNEEELSFALGANEVAFRADSFSVYVVGTIISTATGSWNDFPGTDETGDYLMLLRKNGTYYVADSSGSVKVLEGTVEGNTVTINKIGGEDLESAAQVKPYLWEYRSYQNTKKDLQNNGKYIDPANSMGLSSSAIEQKYDSKTGTFVYSLSHNGGLSMTTGRVLFRNIEVQPNPVRYSSMYLDIDIAENKLSGGNTANSGVAVYFANVLMIDGKPINADDIVTGQIADNPWAGGTSGEGSGSGSGGGNSGLPQDLSAPDTKKKLISNGDGTYDLSLSVTGQSIASSGKTNVDVVVVFDTSGSISTSGLLDPLQEAAKAMSSSLLNDNSEGNVRIKVVNFGSKVDGVSEWFTEKGEFDAYIDRLTTQDQTNWQAGLYEAGDTLFNEGRPDAEKIVVFLTDGVPTHYYSWSDNGNGNQLTTRINGNDNSNAFSQPAYDAAARVVTWLVDAGYSLYGVAAGNASGLNRVQNLISYAYNGSDAFAPPEGRFYTASSDDLVNVFKNISDDILRLLQYKEVTITDGLSPLTHMSVNGNVGNFKYSWTKEGEFPEAFKTAQFVKKGSTYIDPVTKEQTVASEDMILWRADESYTLENQVTYTLRFTVWPDQSIYDLIADLNNGVIEYDDLTEDQQASIQGEFPNYTIKTNTEAKVYYTSVRLEDGLPVPGSEKPGIVTTDDPEPQQLKGSNILLQKIWKRDLQPGTPIPENADHSVGVTIDLLKGESPYIPNIKLNESNKWQKSVSLAPGIMILKTEENAEMSSTEVMFNNKTYLLLNEGHDYSFYEHEKYYNFELEEKVYHPMLIDGVMMNVIFEKNDDSITVSGDETLDSTTDEDDNTVFILEATNELKGGINITKQVVGANNEPVEIPADEEFTVKVTVTAPEGGLEDFSVLNGDYVVWYVRFNANGERDISYEDGNNYLVFNDQGVATGTFTMHNKEMVRLTNVVSTSTYTVEELNRNEQVYDLDLIYQHKIPGSEGEEDKVIVDEGATSGTVEADAENNVIVSNVIGMILYHSYDNTFEYIKRSDLAANGGKIDLTSKVKGGCLYGGYYTDYAGKSSSFAFRSAIDSFLAGTTKDEGGKPYSYANIASESAMWSWANACEEDGQNLVPGGMIYYLKEVPKGYLKPYTQYTYFVGSDVLGRVWCVLGTDDLNYQNAGFSISTSEDPEYATMVKILKFRAANNENATVQLTASDAYGKHGVKDGFLGYGILDDYVKVDGVFKTTATIRQFWTTKDGVTVYGVTQREISFGDGTRNNLKVNDTEP